MKTELKAKFLQYLNQNKKDEGFTLIELLVVIIIIGILSAIALPSFLNQANKARESEAKTYVGSMNRAQQAYYLEKQDFVNRTEDIGLLGLGIATQTENYEYKVQSENGVGDQTNDTQVANMAQPRKGDQATVRAYVGATQITTNPDTSEATTVAILCQGAKAPIGLGGAGTGGFDAIKFGNPVAGESPKCVDPNYENL
ncbi:type IV pilin-like G/H family protein [Lyngbya aestuarii]|uniref:type IV pilin-like G/H family protein n=1 Tax=Lyngbya aestuarii TaxID=118322 RepID=UPI00403DC90A